MKRFALLALAALGMLTAGCANRMGDFTILSTKNVEISRVDLKRVPFQRGVEGADGRVWVLFIPFGAAPNLKEAVDQCLENGNGDFMTSAVLYQNSWSVLLFGYEGIEIKGDVGNSLGAGSGDVVR